MNAYDFYDNIYMPKLRSGQSIKEIASAYSRATILNWYNELYDHSVRNNITREELVRRIARFIESMRRALSLKP